MVVVVDDACYVGVAVVVWVCMFFVYIYIYIWVLYLNHTVHSKYTNTLNGLKRTRVCSRLLVCGSYSPRIVVS